MTAPSRAPSASHGSSLCPSERLPGGAGRRPPPPPSRFRPFRLARAGRLAACLLAAALYLLPGAQTAQAQTTVQLVSNTGQSNDGESAFGGLTGSSRVAFTTGSNAAGYVLQRVDIVSQAFTGTTPVSAAIHEDSSGSPGTSLGTLTNPASLPNAYALAQFTASGTGIALAANTTFHLVLSGNQGTVRVTSSDAQTGSTGWSIADSGQIAGSASSSVIKMAVHGVVKSAPTVANAIPNQSAVEGLAFSYTFPENTFNDADGDTLTYTATLSDDTALPGWLTFTAGTRTFTGMPATVDIGTLSVKVTASDGANSVSDTFDIVVRASNNAPTVANQIPDQTAVAGTAFSYTFPENTFNDADGDTLTYSAARVFGNQVTGLPAWLTFTASTRTFSGTPQAGDVETVTVRVVAGDGFDWARDDFEISVLPDLPPAFVGAAVNGAALTATFDEALDPGFAGSWAVDVDGTVAGAAAGTPSGNVLTLTLAAPVRRGQTVKLLYIADGATAVRDAAGNRMGAWSDGFRAVRNVTPPADDRGPSVAAATVNGTAVSVTFDWALDVGSVPAPGAFRVTAGGAYARHHVASGGVAIADATTVRLTLTSAVEPGQRVWVSYVAPSANPLRDTTGAEVAGFPARRVVNRTPYTVASARQGHVVIPFDRPIVPSACPSPSAWRVTGKSMDGGRAVSAFVRYVRCHSRSVELRANWSARDYFDWPRGAAVSYDKTKAVFALDSPLPGNRKGQRLKYADDDSEVESFTDLPVAGLTQHDWTRPKPRFARVDGATLTIVFPVDLDPGGRPPGSRFEVRASGVTATGVGAAQVSGGTVKVHLDAVVSATPGRATVTYTAPNPTTPGLPALRNLGGYRFPGMMLHWVPVHPDTAPPELAGATVSGASLTLAFDEMLDADSVPAPGNFRVTVNGARLGVAADGVAIDGTEVRLTLASAVRRADTVRVRYSRGRSPLRDLSGNTLARFADRTADNRTPAGPAGPSFRGASVNGAALTVTFDETLDADSVPSPGNFRVIVDGARHNVAAGGVAIDDKTVTLTLASAASAGEAVTVSYTKPSTNPLRDPDGNDAASFTGVPVTNNSPVQVWSATLTVNVVTGTLFLGCIGDSECSVRLTDNSFTYDGATYRVIFIYYSSITDAVFFGLDKAVPLEFTLNVDDRSLLVANASISNNNATAQWVVPDLNWTAGQKVSLSLTTSTGDVGGLSGQWGDAGPSFQSAVVQGDELTVTFDEALDEDSAPAGSSFTVTAASQGGASRTLAGTGTASVSGQSVTVTLDAAVAGAETLTVRYARPDSNPLRDADGNDAANFSGRPATNKPVTLLSTARTPPGAPTGVTVSGASATSLSVSWTAPADTGSAAVAGYELRWYAGASDPADASAWTGTGDVGAGTGATISNLAADTAYRVQVRARGDGTGPWSASGTGRTEAAGAVGQSGGNGPPAPVSATIDYRTVTVTFDKPLAAVGAGAGLHFYLTVTGAGVEQHPVRASASGRKVTGTLDTGSPARAGRSYAIAYFGDGPLRGEAGDVAFFSGLAAENLTLPALRVADARAGEGADATLDFVVSLDAAMAKTVTVDYATADGTATWGEDYTPASGTLTFAAGERRKTVSVAILDDALDEGEETLLLRLSNASGARIGDGEAVGTIENDDPLQKMWLSRFGRTVAGHVTDAVSDRLANPLSGAQVTLGGQTVDLAETEDEALLGRTLTSLAHLLGGPAGPAPADVPGPLSPGPGPGQAGAGLGFGSPGSWSGAGGGSADAGTPGRLPEGRELLLGSAFHLAREGDGRAPGLTAWGRVTAGGFDGEAPADGGSVRIDGSVTTGILGADAEWSRLLAGVAVSVSEGEGRFAQPGVDTGTIESTMTTVSPYARFMVTDRVSVWGLAGWGTGHMTIVQAANDRGQPERATRTDLEMRLAAIGGRGALMQADETGGFDLALKSDAFWVETEADAVSNEGNTVASASRVRLALEGSRAFQVGGGTLTPGVELGLRHDGGDAETGTGVELGGRVSWADPETGLGVEARVRGLIAHEDSSYKEWGASGAVRLAPGERGRGFSFSLAPSYGAAGSGVDRLWSARDARGLAPGTEFEAGQRLEGELGYGFGLFGDRFTGTPNLGFGLSDVAREYRIGWRLTSVVRGDPGFEVNLDATRREAANDNGPAEHGMMLRGAIRW